MKKIGSVNPGRKKLVTLWNGDPEGPVRTFHRDKYRLFLHQKMARQQRLDATVRDGLHELSQWPGKVATCDDFENYLEAQEATWSERFEVGTRQSGARRRFDIAIGKRKVLDKFWRSVRDQENEVVM
jgi:hypothetical protein